MFLQCNVISSVILLLLICHTNFATSYKILVPILTPSKSHYNQAKAICDILHERGHEVTFINGYPGAKLPYREIIVPEINNGDFPISFEESSESYLDKFKYVFETEEFATMMTENAMNSETFQNFLNRDEKFDLIIMDYVLNEPFFALSVKYNCPLILISPAPMIHWLARLTGNPVSPATVPNFFFDFTPDMTFKERILNTIMAVVQDVYGHFVYDKMYETFYKKYFPKEAAKVSLAGLKDRISLVLANSHPALGSARAFLPNTVEIGGFHVGEVKPLPKEYKEILDNATNGVIYFSMGSFLKTHTMPKYMRDIILKSLSKLKETVIWKFEADLPDLPKNVIIKKWMPQTSILAHPNVKMFISHGGILSVIESTVSGVPVLTIPVVYDQFHNAKMIEHAKTGIIMTLENLSEAKFDKALNEVLNNKIYTENANKIKKLYADRPMSPRDLVSFYAEHVIRTAGAKHLSPPHLNLFSSMLLDVIAVLLIPPLLIVGATFFICRKICCAKKKKQINLEKKTK